jgi:hypothetical protein
VARGMVSAGTAQVKGVRGGLELNLTSRKGGANRTPPQGALTYVARLSLLLLTGKA